MERQDTHRVVIPADFPELAKIMWSMDPTRAIDEREALALYERNWRFVDQAAMPPHEVALVRRLVTEQGHGLLLGR